MKAWRVKFRRFSLASIVEAPTRSAARMSSAQNAIDAGHYVRGGVGNALRDCEYVRRAPAHDRPDPPPTPEPDYRAEMQLPGGKTCGDCVHCERCCAIFGHAPTDTSCDWWPSRYREGAVGSVA